MSKGYNTAEKTFLMSLPEPWNAKIRNKVITMKPDNETSIQDMFSSISTYLCCIISGRQVRL